MNIPKLNTEINTFSTWITDGLSDLEIKKIKDLARISAAIELRRKELGMNQKQFAAHMGVSQAMVSKWESGEYNFTINTLNEICAKLGLFFYPDVLHELPDRSGERSSQEVDPADQDARLRREESVRPLPVS